MFRTLILSAATLLALGTAPALAAGPRGEIIDFEFPHEGPFGRFDAAQLQRGLQVFRENCVACHGLEHVAFRTLTQETGPALSDEAMRAFAATFEVEDPVTGEFRPAVGSDHFPHSAMSNAPDLSLVTKFRVGFSGPYGLGINQLMNGMGGAEYVASFLMGFTGRETIQAGVPFYFNSATNSYKAMANVLFDDGIVYTDGTPATAVQQAQDVAAFLMWTAEPWMTERKRAGWVGVVLLTLLASLLYLTNKRLWAPIKARAKLD